ncbi:MAG: YHS domain-containing protein [Candidatus Binatia bacterium]
MKRIVGMVFMITVSSALAVPVRAAGDEREPQHREAAAPAKAKIGDSVACAVDGMRMRLEADTPIAEYRGKTYYFCSEAEKQMFLKDPEHYIKH